MVYMGSQKSSRDHFLGVVFNEESHGDLCFSPFCRPDTAFELQSQTTRTPWHPPVLESYSAILFLRRSSRMDHLATVPRYLSKIEV